MSKVIVSFCVVVILVSIFFAFNGYFNNKTTLHGYVVPVSSDSLFLVQEYLGHSSDDLFILGSGFTSCPAVCPLLAAKLSAIIEATESRVDVYFFTVDLARDDQHTLDKFVRQFHPDLIGVRLASEQRLAKLNNVIKQSIYKHPNGDIDHSGMIYMFNPKNNTLVFYPNTAVDNIISDIKFLGEG